MDGTIFVEWLRELDHKFERRRRKIIIIANNCPVDPEIKGLKSIDLQFLPPNTMYCTQPMDQGVIRYVDFVYNKFIFDLLKKFVLRIETVPHSIEEKVFFLEKITFYKNKDVTK